MMGIHVKIQFEGIQEVMNRLSEIGEKAEHNVQTELKDLADDTKTAWKEGTPEGKTKRLRGDEDVQAAGLEFTLQSPTKYYKFVDEGHRTRRRRNGKPRSFVKGREMTKKATEFIHQNLERRLSKFLDNV